MESRAESYIRQTFQRCQTRDTLNATFPATQHDTSKVVCNDLKITSALKSRKKSFYFLEFLFFTKGILGSRKMYGNKQLGLPISALYWRVKHKNQKPQVEISSLALIFYNEN